MKDKNHKDLCIHDRLYSIIKQIGRSRFGNVYKVKINESNFQIEHQSSQILVPTNNHFHSTKNSFEEQCRQIDPHSFSLNCSKKSFSPTFDSKSIFSNELQKIYALKIIKIKSPKTKEQKPHLNQLLWDVITEINILARSDHKCIQRLYDFKIAEDHTQALFLLQYGKYGNLISLINKVKQIECLRKHSEIIYVHVLAQIVAALCYLQQKKVLHRDLKAENVVLDKYLRARLIDFGSASILPESEFHKQLSPQHRFYYRILEVKDIFISEKRDSNPIGSPHYISPEMIDKSHVSKQNKETDYSKTDIWSFGVLAYILFTQSFPFSAKNNYLIFQKIKKGLFDLEKVQNKYVRELITGTLVVDPKKRLTLSQIKSLPLFSFINFESIQSQRSPIIRLLKQKTEQKVQWIEQVTVKDIRKNNLRLQKTCKLSIIIKKNVQQQINLAETEAIRKSQLYKDINKPNAFIKIQKNNGKMLWKKNIKILNIWTDEEGWILIRRKNKQLFYCWLDKNVLSSFIETLQRTKNVQMANDEDDSKNGKKK